MSPRQVVAFFLLLFGVSTVDAAPHALAFVTPDLNLWAVRAASAAVSYVGLVAYLDAPRGKLAVDPSCLRVGQSEVEGAGLGLFAGQNLRQGTVLGTYPGVVLPVESGLGKLSQYPNCEAYIWRFADSKMIVDPTDAKGDIQDYCVGGNPSALGSVWICNNLLAFLKVPTVLCRINEPPVSTV